ncbi:FHA domain-containing protein [Calothrix rhizosoleniae]|uniref:FHA domain-containing protein n=1 Tax=Calothrix rhizosoleniae TaxID=888997 RepID=UPI000B499898|nr:FHA domain-containing protein [Calothrix rhizosoleniae]
MATHRCPNQKCEYFNRPLPNNVKFCPLCSTPLGNVISKPSANQPPQPPIDVEPPPSPVANPQNDLSQPITPPQNYNYQRPPSVPSNQPPDIISTQYQPRPATPPIVQPNPHNPSTQKIPTLKLVHTSGQEFFLPGEQGIIGRRSSGEPNFIPDIDLSVLPNQGVVSRRHGRIYWDWSQNTYMIVDMSTNGIYLNNNLLNPGIPYRLISGVPMQLGQDGLVLFTILYI